MEAAKLQICTTVILGGIFFLCFGVFNRSKIPVEHHAGNFNLAMLSSANHTQKGMLVKV